MDNLNIYVGQCCIKFFRAEEQHRMIFYLFTDEPEHLEELHRFAEVFKISHKCFKEDSYFPHYEVIQTCGCKTLRLAACPIDDIKQKEFISHWQELALRNRFQ